jgi:pilus assembly protein CpaE
MALSRTADVNPLLMDFDLNCGMTRFMLKLSSSYSTLDAAEHAANMDEDMWRRIVSRHGRLDIVHAGVLNPEIRLQNMQIRHLLDYTRRDYKVVCVDLSGNLEKYSMEIMHESKAIFLVCTAEPASLHLAKEKLQYLSRMDLGHRVCVLLNRYVRRSSISPSEVEQIVGAPVRIAFANDYARVARAVQQGKEVDPASELGRSCADLAAHMLDRKPAPKEPSRRSFAEYFNLSPARFTLERTKP